MTITVEEQFVLATLESEETRGAHIALTLTNPAARTVYVEAYTDACRNLLQKLVSAGMLLGVSRDFALPPRRQRGRSVASQAKVVRVFRLGPNAWEADQPGNMLHGIRYPEIDYKSPRAARLFAALKLPCEEGQGVDIGELTDGRWALVGTLVPGCEIAVEVVS